ncbi:MAG TPA: ribulose-phosphate 3-epimerase [Abditibacteriaceae bacterium]|nr:ribulose-phosphate 3-epimerase [Abditibacteriaceae bacterium]
MTASNSRSIIIAPSMISADWWNVSEDVCRLEAAGCQWLHFDAMDAHFVPNFTLGPMFLKAVRPHSPLHFDAHLMMSDAGIYIDEFVKAGANSISVHVEANAHLHRVIGKIKDLGALAGVVVNPATPIRVLDAILPDLDYVLVMSVNPGFGGQKFLPLCLPKIAWLKQQREERGLNFLVQVDGGVSVETAPHIVRAGADVLVIGSALFRKDVSLEESVRELRASFQNEPEA